LEHAGLNGRQIHAAELQKLPVMVEAAQSPVSAKMVRALIGPMPGIMRSSC